LLAQEIRSKPPVLLIHAMPIPSCRSRHESAAKALKARGWRGDSAPPGLPHSIDEEGMAAGIAFLAQAFGAG